MLELSLDSGADAFVCFRWCFYIVKYPEMTPSLHDTDNFSIEPENKKKAVSFNSYTNIHNIFKVC